MSEESGSSRFPAPMSQSMSLPPWCPCAPGELESNPAVVPVFPFPELLAVPMSAPSNAGVAGRHCASLDSFCSMGILSCRIASCAVGRGGGWRVSGIFSRCIPGLSPRVAPGNERTVRLELVNSREKHEDGSPCSRCECCGRTMCTGTLLYLGKGR